MSFRARLDKLAARGAARGARRLLFLIPDLWPETERAAFETLTGDGLADLVERRTGIRPVPETGRVWAIVVPAPDDAGAWSPAERAAFLAAHETRAPHPAGGPA